MYFFGFQSRPDVWNHCLTIRDLTFSISIFKMLFTKFLVYCLLMSVLSSQLKSIKKSSKFWGPFFSLAALAELPKNRRYRAYLTGLGLSYGVFTRSSKRPAKKTNFWLKVKVVNLCGASLCTTYTSNALFVTNQSRRSHSRRVQPANIGWRTGQPGSPVSCTKVLVFCNPYNGLLLI